ncbi:hypothetical protein [Polaribacter sp. Hel_I_88]|uniref:hypothetical protein n=1 Tax=Polaribacter sp. Hel_I_88 TaxID=1250006 RepID=UPI000AA08461|nr:hypothetical protein [Polaribacter sp. Hel_I_88]
MKKIILLLNILFLFNSCGTKPKTTIENKELEIMDVGTIDLNKKKLKLKIGPTWYDNESEFHLVFGVTQQSSDENYITELHFNYGGNIDCENKTLSAIFDFKNSKDLILSDSINKLLPVAKNIIQRKQKNSSIEFDFKNPSPGKLVFAIEKVNLKPNKKQNKINLKIKSQCEEYLNLPIILAKYTVSEADELINNYINNELNLLPENELKNLKVIFSFNQVHKTEKFLIDMVDQRNMQILSYDYTSKKYILTDIEKNKTQQLTSQYHN